MYNSSFVSFISFIHYLYIVFTSTNIGLLNFFNNATNEDVLKSSYSNQENLPVRLTLHALSKDNSMCTVYTPIVNMKSSQFDYLQKTSSGFPKCSKNEFSHPLKPEIYMNGSILAAYCKTEFQTIRDVTSNQLRLDSVCVNAGNRCGMGYSCRAANNACYYLRRSGIGTVLEPTRYE